MFRRLPETLPKDPIIPADLTQLGYFVNNEDQIKQLLKPNEKYKYLINKNERVNEVLKEAMNSESLSPPLGLVAHLHEHVLAQLSPSDLPHSIS